MIRASGGRLSGDEFALALLMQDAQQGAAIVAAKIRDALLAPFDLQGHQVTVTVSIGITVYPVDPSEPGTSLRYADTAIYRAKQAGRDTYRFFTAPMNAGVMARLELETALRKALENDEFVLAIIRMSPILKLQTIADGVETAAQMAYLHRHRCDLIQGYCFSRPLPVMEMETMLRAKKCLPRPEPRARRTVVA